MTSIKQRISKTIEHLNHVNTTLQYTPPLACFFIRETAHIKQRMEKYINGENFNLSRSVGSSLSTGHTGLQPAALSACLSTTSVHNCNQLTGLRPPSPRVVYCCQITENCAILLKSSGIFLKP